MTWVKSSLQGFKSTGPELHYATLLQQETLWQSLSRAFAPVLQRYLSTRSGHCVTFEWCISFDELGKGKNGPFREAIALKKRNFMKKIIN